MPAGSKAVESQWRKTNTAKEVADGEVYYEGFPQNPLFPNNILFLKF